MTTTRGPVINDIFLSVAIVLHRFKMSVRLANV